MFTRMFASKEVNAILAVLNEADQKFDCSIFRSVKSYIEQTVRLERKTITAKIHDGLSPRLAAYSMIAEVSGNMAESGQYHIYRGFLNPIGGEDLLRIYDAAVDEMVRGGAVDSNYAEEQKAGLRENIKSVG